MTQFWDENNASVNNVRFKEIDLNQDEPEENFLYPTTLTSYSDHSGKKVTIKTLKSRDDKDYQKSFRNSGSGEIRIDRFMSKISSLLDEKVLVIEEPESFLDPINQIKILSKIGELAKTRQVFITTHSPYIINWSYLANGASLIKLNRNTTPNTSEAALFKNESIAKLIAKPHKRTPHLSSIETKNIFFSDKVFLVEGHEDVGLITQYLDENKIDYDFVFFGFGAGGSSKIKDLLKLCKDLKISKVAALFDRDEKDQGKHYEECKKLYSPVYQIEELKAQDIRDKADKTGVFTDDNKLKEDEFGKDFEEKLKSILDYFKS